MSYLKMSVVLNYRLASHKVCGFLQYFLVQSEHKQEL